MKTVDNDILDKMKDIKQFDSWKIVKKLELGWSSDSKFYIETVNNEKLLLRLSSIDQYDQKKKEFEIINIFHKLGFKMSTPIEFGVCGNNKHTYMILSYIEGDTLEDVLSDLDTDKQYELGRKAGIILRQIHDLDIGEYQQSYSIVDKKLRQLEKYETSNLRIKDDEKIISFVKENIHLLDHRKPTFQHGDFHPGNLILTKDHEIGVIDFNRWDVADPYEEFYKVSLLSSLVSIPFCIGQIEAYFNNDIPESFWKILSVYVAQSVLYSIKWAEPYGEKEVEHMRNICIRVAKDYHHFDQIIPSWFIPIQSKKSKLI